MESMDNDIQKTTEHISPPITHHSPNDTPPGHGNQIQAPHTRLQRLKHWLGEKLTKKQYVIGAIVFVLLLGSAIAIGVTRSATAPVQHQSVKPKTIVATPVKPIVYYSPLSGLPVTKSQTTLPVTAVMIENSDGARPQSGMSQAGIIFEALAEGGITRFMALYQENQPTSIGPIRSARPYYVDWLLPFNAGYAHVGGSPTALANIKSLGVRDMDEFYNANSYHRVSSREAPHNVYTSMADLNTLETSKGWTTSTFTGFPRKADSPAKTPTTTTINLNPSYADMASQFQYDPSLNSYKRNEAGAPMVDAATNKQLEPKVVIAMVVPWSNGPLDASGAYYVNYADLGTGTAYVFQDGILTQGVWKKTSPSSQLQFVTTSGTPINLNAGQTWITALGAASDVSYK